ncbi:putative membrane protein [Candidatus Ichthyocystis hellenicum]|uniref:Putative membrane protein n=1 Tax=Candidatus Ichthyocystis hellenicum TaxID=1561003 RepID=A0A0S4M919_9BURK|nr:hypothetical protein [Candidatus Ichthyocystis hellenicum]CUT17940.1 putative membrane protein [Candidatus Ichthyocystis hellenicum]
MRFGYKPLASDVDDILLRKGFYCGCGCIALKMAYVYSCFDYKEGKNFFDITLS